MKYLKILFDFSGYEDHPERWGEPTDGAMLAVFLGSLAFWTLLFWFGC